MAESPSPSKRRPRRRVPVFGVEKERFLEGLAAGWSISRAAEFANVHKRRLYEARERDEGFAQAWAEAYEAGTQLLEDELRRRSVDGWAEETFDGDGALVRRVQRLHPNDLHFQLAMRRPELRSTRVDGRLDVKASIDSPQIQEAIAAFTSRIAVLAAAAPAGVLEAVDAEVVEE